HLPGRTKDTRRRPASSTGSILCFPDAVLPMHHSAVHGILHSSSQSHFHLFLKTVGIFLQTALHSRSSCIRAAHKDRHATLCLRRLPYGRPTAERSSRHLQIPEPERRYRGLSNLMRFLFCLSPALP